MINFLEILFLFFLVLNANAAKVKIEDISYEEGNAKSILSIKLASNLDEYPELKVKGNYIQVSVPNSYVWPKVKKTFTYKNSFDSEILAYQFEKDLVRIRAVFPNNVEKIKKNVSLQMIGNEIIVNFPKGNQLKVGRAPAVIGKPLVADEKSGEARYDESYLEKLLKEKEDVKIKDEKLALDNPEEQKKNNNKNVDSKTTNDEVKFTLSSSEKKNSWSMTEYVGKFAGFLILILVFFYGLVTFFKKGALQKGKLGFLNSTKVVEVLNTTYIAPKRTMLLIRAHNQVFLVGNSEKGFDMISEVKDLSGIYKEGEKKISGTNFDSNLSSAQVKDKEFKLKEILISEDDVETDSNDENYDESIALKAIENEMIAANKSQKIKFSDQIKNKVKSLKPLH